MPASRKRLLAFMGAGLASLAVLAAAATMVMANYRDDGPADDTSSALAFAPNPNSRQYGTGAQIELLQERLKKDPEDFEANIALAVQFMQKVRETGDSSLYTRAEKALDVAARSGSNNPEYWATRAQLDLGRHEFASAREWAQKAVTADNERSRFWGLLADAQIELGQYKEAIESLQQMVDRRPDFSSFSRIAYARELYGDPEGAIDAMEQAIAAGTGVPENLAWAYAETGRLEFSMNNIDRATMNYDLALQTLPEFPAALAGKARIAAATGDFATARDNYALALQRLPLAEYAVGLGDVLRAMGDEPGAARQYELVLAIDRLQSQNGVNTDLEVALFLADQGADPEMAVARARAAYAERPNIHAADALAWALFQAGHAAEAAPYAQEALRLGSRDSLKLFHAGLIARTNGDMEMARTYLFEALRFNPQFSLRYGSEAKATLLEIGGNLPAAAS